MAKRCATEAFGRMMRDSRSKPISAYAAARARKATKEATAKAFAEAVDGNLADDPAIDDDITVKDNSSAENDIHAGHVSSHPETDSRRPPPVEIFQTSTHQPSSETLLDDGSIAIMLNEGEQVACLGTYDLEVERGIVTIYGATLGPGLRHRIFSPITHALPLVQCRVRDTKILLRSVADLNPDDGSSAGPQCLSPLSPLWHHSIRDNTRGSFRIIHTTSDQLSDRILTTVTIDDEDQQVLNKIGNAKGKTQDPVVTLVLGAKGSGKSTFCKHLLNTILTSPSRQGKGVTCFWLDLDPGQPEFNPPGHLSLVQARTPIFGPPYSHSYTHPALAYRTIRSHVLGANSPVEDQKHYLACVADLLDAYASISKSAAAGSPLVINSPGWITGSGAILIQHILAMDLIHEIVLMESPGSSSAELVSAMTAAETRATVTTLYNTAKLVPLRPASEFRSMQSMSYFHSKRKPDDQIIWSDSPLHQARPWVASYAGREQLIHGIMSYHDEIDPEDLAMVLEGLAVSIVIVTAGRQKRTEPFKIIRTPEDLPHLISYSAASLQDSGRPLDPRNSHCIGQAIVKHIDTESKTLHLLTPVSDAEIQLALQEAFTKDDGNSMLVLVRGKPGDTDWYFTEGTTYRANGDSDETRAYEHESRISHHEYDDDSTDVVSLDSDDQGEWVDNLGFEGDDVARARGLLSAYKEKKTKRKARKRPHEDFVAPYVSLVADDALHGENGDVKSSSAEGKVLGSKVWRARHLPRNTAR